VSRGFSAGYHVSLEGSPLRARRMRALDRLRMSTAVHKIATMILAMGHAKAQLEPRAQLDAAGADLLHEVNNVLTMLELGRVSMPPPDELRLLTERCAVLHQRVAEHIMGRRFARLAGRLYDSSRPAPAVVAQIQAAQIGPAAEPGAERVTMVECPACRGCLLCADVRLVTVAEAEEWRKRNLPRGA
jgi:hypothetical protein